MKKKLLKQPLFYTNIVLLLLFLFFILGMSGKISFANSIIQQLVGGGTQNSVAAFNSSNSLTNSQIYDNGTNVGIGTTNPSSKLDVNGYGQFISPDNGSTGGVRIVAPSNNSQGFIQFTNNARSSEWADISADQGGNLFLRPAGNGNLWANNSITASGNVYGNDICTFGGKCLSQAGGGLSQVTTYNFTANGSYLGIHKFCFLSKIQYGWYSNIGNSWIAVNGTFNGPWYLSVTGAHPLSSPPDQASEICVD